MTTVIEGQLSIFDVLVSKAEELVEAASPIQEAGTFTHPGDLEAMYNQKRAWHTEYHVDNGNWRPYRGWTAKQYSGKDSEHVAQSFDADLRCQHYWRNPCQCVGPLVYRVYCHSCDHWTGIYDNENLAWEEHLDHCWPGWQDLPVLESRQVGYGYKWEIPADYPARFQQVGAPLRDCRGNKHVGGRHVPGMSPFGGLAVGSIQPCAKHGER